MSEKLYSYSRLGCYHNCLYEFYQSYILGNKGTNNAYGYLGGETHEIMEELHPGNITRDEALAKFKESFVMCDLMGYKFPNENIKKNYHDAILDFIYWYETLPNDKSIIEEGFKIDINGAKLRGFIDLSLVKDGQMWVVDWKSSSWSGFSGATKLLEKGRQLALYASAIEEKHGIRPIRASWVMMKYVHVKYKTKRSKRIERQKFVQEFMPLIMDEMVALGYSPAEISLELEGKRTLMDVANINPDILKNFATRMAFIHYDISDLIIKEARAYVKDTAVQIESMGKEESDYPPVELNKSTTFFCQHLCNHGKTCKYYKQHQKDNSPDKAKKDFDKIFN